MKNSKKTWGMLGTSMGSMLIIVALLTMVGIGSSDTYAAKKVCTCSEGRWVQGTDKCAITKDEDYTCQPGAPNLKSCEGDYGPLTCTCTQKKTTFVAASCKDIDDSDDTDDKPNKPTPPAGGDDDDDKPNKPTKPSGGDDDSGKNIGNCPAGTYYLGLNHAADCPSGYYCPGGTYNANTGDVISGCEKIACPANATCTSSSYTCNKGYHPSSGGCVKDGTSGGDDDKPNNPNKPSGGGDDGLGGNGGGNTGGNGNGGNTGGNNGNNNGGNNATKNPNTATKAPLVIALIGIMSVGISSVVYFKGKKEINTEI